VKSRKNYGESPHHQLKNSVFVLCCENLNLNQGGNFMKIQSKKHAVMMEYVIIAVLIAAAVVVAVIMFGKNVSSEMNVATQAMSDAKGAETSQQTIQEQAASDIKKASEHEKSMHNYK